MDIQVKIYFENNSHPDSEHEIRRFSLSGDDETYAELRARIAVLCPDRDLTSSALYWKDAENDLIAVSSDDELKDILSNRCADGILKLYVIDTDSSTANTCENKRGRQRTRNADGSRRQRHSVSSKRVPIVWAPHIRRGMRRCMIRAWIFANCTDDAQKAKPRDVPSTWREWMKTEIGSKMSDVREHHRDFEDVAVQSNPEAEPGKPIDEVPMFWRRSIRQCTKKAWESMRKEGDGDTSAVEGTNQEMPVPLRRFMRKVMLNTWQTAKDEMHGGDTQRRCRSWSPKSGATEEMVKNMRRMRLHKADISKVHEGRPFWGIHMRRCMRNCMSRAWVVSTHSRDGGMTSHPRNIPQQWRDWMRNEINKAVTKARDESKVEDEDHDPSAEVGSKMKSLPEFWRKNIRQCTRKAWKRSQKQNIGDNQAQANSENEALPKPLRRYMGMRMMHFWEMANEMKNVDELAEGDVNMKNGENGLPQQWRKAMRMGMCQAVMEMKKTAKEDPDVDDKEGCGAGDDKIPAETLESTRQAVREAWHLHMAKAYRGEPRDRSREIPKPWRQAMRRSMSHMWRDAKCGNQNGSNGKVEIPEFWKNFMRQNIQASWKKVAAKNGEGLKCSDPAWGLNPDQQSIRINRRLENMRKRRQCLEKKIQKVESRQQALTNKLLTAPNNVEASPDFD